jgi:hypothetical protein
MKINKREQIEAEIYNALQHWDMNPYSKRFAHDLSVDIMKLIVLDDAWLNEGRLKCKKKLV